MIQIGIESTGTYEMMTSYCLAEHYISKVNILKEMGQDVTRIFLADEYGRELNEDGEVKRR